MIHSQTTPHLKDLLCFSLYAANNAMHRLYLPLLEPLKLTYAQYVVLIVLWEKDGVAVTHIGEQLGLETNTLTPLLKRMEAAGLLKRRRNPDDERQVLVSLTSAGQRLRGQTAHIPSCIAEATGMRMPKIMGIHSGLGDLRKSLGKSAIQKVGRRKK